jgi:hypothetical protein
MWAKTMASFFCGMLVSASLTLNISHFLPLGIDVKLLVGYVTSFLIWAGVMSYFFCFQSLRRPLTQSLVLLTISVALNITIKLGAFT